MAAAQCVLTRDRTVEDLVTERMARLPTHFGRLVYLSRCRDSDESYRHSGLETTHDAATVHAALERAHERCFAEWLALSPGEQHADIVAYFRDVDRGRVIEAWLAAEPWRAIAPGSADTHQRIGFSRDLHRLMCGLLP